MYYILNSKILELLQIPKGIFSKFVSIFSLLCCLLALSNQLFGQCPTVDQPVQTFCDVESILVVDLQAIDNGSGIVWYDTPTSTTALSPTDGLIDGEDYYADDNSGTCGTRERVDVIIYSEPTGAPFQGVCVDNLNDATIADLEANGNDVQWYASSTGGSPLPDTTVITDETLYYADQQNPVTGCRTSRLSVFVNVGFVPTPTGDSNQTFCNDPENPPTVGDLVASGNIVWYATRSSSLPLDENQLLANNEDYYAATVDPPCESDTRLRVMVNLDSPNNSGTSGEILVCETDVQSTGTISLRDGLGGSPSNNGTWSGPFPTSGGPNGNVDITNMTVAGSPYIFTYTVDSPSTLCDASSSTVSVSIIEPPNAGEDASIELCSNDSPLDLFGLLGGSPESGGTWSPALASGTGVFDPSIDAAGIYTYTVDGPAPCGPATAQVTVTIIEEPDAGENGSLELCSNDGSTDLFASLGGSPDLGGSWSPALVSGTGIFDPEVDSAGVYTYTVDGTDPCGPDSATVTVSIIEEPDAGEDADLEVCSNDGPTDLFSALGGTPETGGSWSPALTSGTGVFDPSVDTAGTYTYTVNGTSPCGPDTAEVTVTIVEEPDAGENGNLELCSNDAPTDLFASLGGSPDLGGSWSPALVSGTGIFDPEVDSAGVYTYTVDGTDPCGPDSATVTVSIIEEPDAGEDADLEVCSNDGPTDLFSALGGTPETGGSWSPALTSGTGVFDPSVDTAGTYTYTVNGTSPCGPDTAEITVTIIEEPDAGENGNLELCSNDAPTDLFSSLGGTPAAGGFWSPALTSGTGVFDPSVDPAGTYTYTVDGTDPCGPDSATVTVSIIEEPDAGEDADLEVCSNDGPTDLFDVLGGMPDTGGTWSPALSSGNGVFDPSVDAAGVYTYTVNGTSPCGPDSSEVTVTIIEEPDAGEDGAITFCPTDSPSDLFNSLTGTPDLGGTWSPALSSGTGVFNPSVDAAGVYTYTVNGASPCDPASAAVTVTITDELSAGENGSLNLCADDAPTDLFDSLLGSPDPGGIWSPALASNSGIFDPSLDSPGTYTYTIGTGSSCGENSAEVTVTVEETPNAGADGTVDLCSTDSSIDLFDFLGGNPDVGGTWSPALASGTGVFDPSIDAAGSYAYTVEGSASCEPDSSTVTVSIEEQPDAGEDAVLDLCTNDSPVDLFASLGGTPDSGGNWSPALSSGTGVFDPAIDNAGDYTYSVEGNGECDSDSAIVSVNITEAPDAGDSAGIDLCTNDGPIDLFDILGGTPDTGGIWSPALASGTGVFDPVIDAEGTYTYTVAGTDPCEDASASVSVSIVEFFDAGENGSITLCSDGSSVDLFDSLGGSPDAGGIWSPSLASGTGVFDPAIDPQGNYTYTIGANGGCGESSAQVEVSVTQAPNAGIDTTVSLCSNDGPTDLFELLQGNPDVGGIWTPALTSGTGVFDPAVDAAGDYSYNLDATSPCSPSSSTVSVTITQEPQAGEDAIIELCDNDDPIDLLTLLGNDVDAGGSWSPVLASGTNIFDPIIDAEGNYTYTVSGDSPCGPDDATVSITIIPGPNAGLGATVQTCDNADPQDLFDSLNGSPDLGGTWSPALASGTGIFDPTVDPEGDYVYTVAATANCPNPDSATVSVSFIEEPDLSDASLFVDVVCLGSEGNVMITGANGLNDGDYAVDYQLTGANEIESTSMISIANGSGSFVIPLEQLPNDGPTQIMVTGLTSNTSTCSSSNIDIPSMEFTVVNLATPELEEGGEIFCDFDNPTVTSLSDRILNEEAAIWYENPTGGMPIDRNEALVDGMTYYGALIIKQCQSRVRLAVTVDISDCVDQLVIPDGFSPNDDGINDRFEIVRIRDIYPDFHIKIYNRYGNLLFEGDRNKNDWDGRSEKSSILGSSIVPTGVYFYILYFNDGERDEIQGRLYLSR